MKQNDRSVQNTVSSVMWNGFQWKSVHFYKVQRRCCPARRNFCVKGRYCCVTSGGWITYRAVWPQWQTSALLLIFALFHWWPHHSHLPLHRSSVPPPKVTYGCLSGPWPSASLLASFTSLSDSLPLGTPSRHFWFTPPLRAASCFSLHGTYILVGAAGGTYGQMNSV